MSKKSENPVCLTVAELAQRLGCPFEGDGDVVIRGVSSLESAGEGDLVFLTLPKFRPLFEQTEASAAVVSLEEKEGKIPYLRSKTPHLTFIKAIEIFFQPYLPEAGIHPKAAIADSAKIGKNVAIGAYSVVGEEVEIGDRTVIFPHVALYPYVKIGTNCILHSQVTVREGCTIGNSVILQNGVVIGADGYGYAQKGDGTHIKIPQMGTVILEDDVEVGANTAIDRAAMDKTIIRRGTKIDNLVQIAHSVEIGTNSLIIAQAGIAGSSKIGKNVIIAGQAGIPAHINIGDNAVIAAQAGVSKDVPADTTVVGSPHMKIKDYWRMLASIKKIPGLIKDLKELKSKIK
ncbi:MAG: UDP-3-O-(3-hydroxymyristoyl)glucosamine N-acyltransferase [Candidatus Aminicenantes bacterium]|nr:UDP-3-O-(3-hydroxymyristoyl)glucosamine N-acyltransferase [Candidatus Aminicenantes bacterium]